MKTRRCEGTTSPTPPDDRPHSSHRTASVTRLHWSKPRSAGPDGRDGAAHVEGAHRNDEVDRGDGQENRTEGGADECRVTRPEARPGTSPSSESPSGQPEGILPTGRRARGRRGRASSMEDLSSRSRRSCRCDDDPTTATCGKAEMELLPRLSGPLRVGLNRTSRISEQSPGDSL